MKFEHTEVFNWTGAMRGMRNPMDSWSKSDTVESICDTTEPYRITGTVGIYVRVVTIGENDLGLAQRLIRAGAEHRKFLRQILVSVDIIAPRYVWTEMDTYKIGTTANSCSTMHKLANYPITSDMFEFDGKDTPFFTQLVEDLEAMRCKYNQTKDMEDFRMLKQALPESFLQRRTVTLNYETILNMLHQRKNHRLKEWSTDFVGWVRSLPYAEELLFLDRE